MKTIQLALQPATSSKNYYVNFYKGDNRQSFTVFYGKDYNSESEAKADAIKEFLSANNRGPLYDTVTLTENNGMQIADSREPFHYKSAIIRVLAIKKA